MTMNQFWANVYGTGSNSQQAEDVQKLASITDFVKAAAAQGVDVESLSDEALAALYNQVMTKKAELEKKAADEAPPPKEEKKESPEEEKLRRAREEHEAKKEAQAKFAENDQAGRQMAHAFVHELRQIQAAQEKEASAQQPQQAQPNNYVNSLLNIAAAHEQKLASELTEEEKKKLKEKEEAASEKKASELDEFGASRAIQMLVEDNKNRALNGSQEFWDIKVAAEKLNAVLLAGPAPTVKTASVNDIKDAIQVRGLELLEQIGVPVNWNALKKLPR